MLAVGVEKEAEFSVLLQEESTLPQLQEIEDEAKRWVWTSLFMYKGRVSICPQD